MAAAQRVVARHKYDPSPVDGRMGPRIWAAHRSWWGAHLSTHRGDCVLPGGGSKLGCLQWLAEETPHGQPLGLLRLVHPFSAPNQPVLLLDYLMSGR